MSIFFTRWLLLDYNRSRASHDCNISALFSAAKRCAAMIEHFLQILYVFFALTGIYLVCVFLYISVRHIFAEASLASTINELALNIHNTSPENTTNNTSRDLGTDVSYLTPNHYTWHREHFSALRRLPEMSDSTNQDVIMSSCQAEKIIDVIDKAPTYESCCICLVRSTVSTQTKTYSDPFVYQFNDMQVRKSLRKVVCLNSPRLICRDLTLSYVCVM